MPTLCPLLTVPCWVGIQSVIMHFLAILYHFETTIIIDDNTIVNYISALA